tara:strand:+ start:17676 stop:18899 length:1224 start_codon:yes stop_codon:yes gene_type:complete
MNPIQRRQFLTTGAALFGAALAPTSIVFGARASRGVDPTLVVIQLSGGNDGLSTVVPYADRVYKKARRQTRIAEDDVLKIDERLGLHPSLQRLHNLHASGKLAIVEGVGYPDGIRSHFKSLEVWHTARVRGRVTGPGWLGRLAEGGLKVESPDPELVVHLGQSAPYSVHSSEHPAVALASPTSYRWFGDTPGVEIVCEHQPTAEPNPATSGRDDALAKMRGVMHDAQASSLEIRAAAARYKPKAEYPRTPFGAQLQDVASLIHGDLGTRVISTSLGGFDTHSNQKGRHDNLMGTLDPALGAFLQDLNGTPEGRSAIVVVFSEFGRRVQENGSRGTDHGMAGPMFVLGHQVKGGLYGKAPSMTELDNGDLKFTTDFRSVYATVLDEGLGVDAKAVLGERYASLGFLGA